MRIKEGVKLFAHKDGPLFYKFSQASEEAASGLEQRGNASKSRAKIKYSAQNRSDILSAPIDIVSQPVVLSCSNLMDKILQALDNSQPLSVISVGATEAFVMAQYVIYSQEEFMSHGEAYNANLGIQSGFFHRGIRFPNIEARNEAVAAAKQADIVGYNMMVDTARELTEKVFTAYSISPQFVFEANLRRVFMFSQIHKFEQMLKDKKILLIGSLASEAEKALNQKLQSRLNFNIVGSISILEYEELPRVRAQVSKYQFDICLISAGVNALILAPYIAKTYGKVAIDIGWGMQSLITDQVVTDAWIDEIIGIDKLLQM